MRAALANRALQPIRNFVPNARTRGVSALAFTNSTGTTITPNIATTGPTGDATTAVRVGYPTGQTTLFPGVAFCEVPFPGPFVVSVSVYTEVAATVAALKMQSDVNPYNEFTLPSKTWTRISKVMNPTTNRVGDPVGFSIKNPSGRYSALTVLLTNAMVTAGPDLIDFRDGLTPGWITLNDGTSAGYSHLAAPVLDSRLDYGQLDSMKVG